MCNPGTIREISTRRDLNTNFSWTTDFLVSVKRKALCPPVTYANSFWLCLHATLMSANIKYRCEINLFSNFKTLFSIIWVQRVWVGDKISTCFSSFLSKTLLSISMLFFYSTLNYYSCLLKGKSVKKSFCPSCKTDYWSIMRNPKLVPSIYNTLIYDKILFSKG